MTLAGRYYRENFNITVKKKLHSIEKLMNRAHDLGRGLNLSRLLACLPWVARLITYLVYRFLLSTPNSSSLPDSKL